MQVELMGDSHRDAAVALLRAHRETSLFLLGNLNDYGPALSDHLNSGDYRVVLQGGAVAAVFVLTRRGNLLVQTDRQSDYAEPILAACRASALALEGVLGDWAVVEPIWRALQAQPPGFETTFRDREVLYRRPTDPAPTAADPAVRTLDRGDFEAWERMQTAFMENQGVPVQGTLAQRRRNFEEKAARGLWWGYFEDGVLVSMAALPIVVDGVGQVGGVFTRPEARRRGLSRKTLHKLMADAAGPLGLHTLVLFTGEANHPAQRMYEALGFEPIGHYGMIFGKVG